MEPKKKVKFYVDQSDFSCMTKKSLKKHMEQGLVEASFKSQKTCNKCNFKYISEKRNWRSYEYKLDGVGPVDNRPSTD